MTRKIFWALIIILIAVLLQSTLATYISVLDILPDIALCILVYMAYNNGVMTGQILGFSSGLMMDFITSAPLGFNALIRTLMGALTGLFKGMFFLDSIFMPFILCALATIIKGIVILILSVFFDYSFSSVSFAAPGFWIEALYNAILAPFVFTFLNLFKRVLVMEKNKA